MAAVLLLGWPVGLVIGALAAPAVHSAAGRLESASTRRREAMARRQLPGALDLVTAALEAGRPPGSALALAAEVTPDPLGPDLSAVAHRMVVAGDLEAAVSDVDGPLLPLARALRRADQSGVPVADVIAAVALDTRREQHAAHRERARRVGVRTAAPLGLCFMPAFLLIGIVPTIIAVASNIQL
ncbi:MAG: type II secretion system F family protein [Aeromicrobium sp.]